MISIYCLRTLLALWLSGKSACLVNKEIPGSNPGSASFSSHTLMCNYVYQVDMPNTGSASFSNHPFVYNYVYQVDMPKLFPSIVYKLTWCCGFAVKEPI